MGMGCERERVEEKRTVPEKRSSHLEPSSTEGPPSAPSMEKQAARTTWCEKAHIVMLFVEAAQRQ